MVWIACLHRGPGTEQVKATHSLPFEFGPNIRASSESTDYVIPETQGLTG